MRLMTDDVTLGEVFNPDYDIFHTLTDPLAVLVKLLKSQRSKNNQIYKIKINLHKKSRDMGCHTCPGKFCSMFLTS